MEATEGGGREGCGEEEGEGEGCRGEGGSGERDGEGEREAWCRK